MTITRRTFSVALAAGVAMPGVLRSARGQSKALKVGMVLPVTGPAADAGKYELTGAKIALNRVNKSRGRPLATSRNSHRGRSNDQSRRRPGFLEARGAARHRCFHRVDPLDTKPCDGARHPEDGETCLLRRHRSAADETRQSMAFRFRPNDSYSARVIAAYGAETSARRTGRSCTRPTRSARAAARHLPIPRRVRRKGRDRSGLSEPVAGLHRCRAGNKAVRRGRNRLVFPLRE